MKVPFRLRKRSETAAAVALLVHSHAPADVLEVCRRLGCDPLPQMYALADGVLLRLPGPSSEPAPGCVRLRALAPALLLPVDADLEPALLPEEAAALVSRRGLVFLPGARVLEFAPNCPLPLSTLLGATALHRGDWRPLPEAKALPERIREFVLDMPGPPPDEILAAGGEGIGTENPRPADSNLPSKALGKAAYGLGKSLAWLGHKLGLGGLTRAGAKMIGGALSLAPRLSEALMGKQEASLRDLLREFREGDVEKALRRALPLGGDRGTTQAGASHLPLHGTAYSLWDILRGTGGAGGGWFSSADTYHELEKEYRKQAELATRKGDYRRAAFIYGRLLRDYRRAASVLAQGGLHRDAARIYEAKLHDYVAAAREYEASGDVDRALRLYRHCGEHALAGDLLRRAGEEEQAIAEYQLAAAKLAATGSNYEAAELLRLRAQRADLALAYYEAGWRQRPGGSPVPCAVRLAQTHTEREDATALLTLLGQAEDYLRPAGNDSPAAEFFNEVGRLAQEPALAKVADALRDRALLALAGKLRQRVNRNLAGSAVATLLGPTAPWAPAVVSDAEFAVKRAARQPGEVATRAAWCATTLLRARIPIVTAACWAPESGEIFVGFQSGEVFLYRPTGGEAIQLGCEHYPVTSLATSARGDRLAVLSGGKSLTSYTREAGYRIVHMQMLASPAEPWLCPLLAGELLGYAALWDGEELQILDTPRFLPVTRCTISDGIVDPVAALLLPAEPSAATPRLLTFLHNSVGYHPGLSGGPAEGKHLGWQPAVPAGSSLQRPAVAWLHGGPNTVEVAAVALGGLLGWARVEFDGSKLAEVTSATAGVVEPCLALTLVQERLLVAVTAKMIQWYRVGGRSLRLSASTAVAMPPAVACFPHHRGNELIVVCGDGTVARVAPLRLGGDST